MLDYDVAPVEERRYYPPHLLVQEVIDIRPNTDSKVANLDGEGSPVVRPQNVHGQRSGLRLSLQEVTGEMKRQIQLRHSAYYENEVVTKRLAEFLTSGQAEATEKHGPFIPFSMAINPAAPLAMIIGAIKGLILLGPASINVVTVSCIAFNPPIAEEIIAAIRDGSSCSNFNPD